MQIIQKVVAAVVAAAIAWLILWPNREISGAPNLGAALTDQSFLIFWACTLVVVTCAGYLLGWIASRKDAWIPVVITGFLLMVNGWITAERFSLTLFGLAVILLGLIYYWRSRTETASESAATHSTTGPGWNTNTR